MNKLDQLVRGVREPGLREKIGVLVGEAPKGRVRVERMMGKEIDRRKVFTEDVYEMSGERQDIKR